MSVSNNGSLYKYSSPTNIDSIFSKEGGATLKYSRPADFNDPFELFLAIDYNRDPDELAFYMDLVGGVVQHPTTCFSKSPIVVPMWAHYAQTGEGFVLEFSEAKLADAFPDAVFGDVDYSDGPKHDLSNLLARAHRIKKFRYNAWLMDAVFSSAYYTKTLCWSYEQERRMIVDRGSVRAAGSLLLLDCPVETVTAIICGAKASPETLEKLTEISDEIGCAFYQVKIGRSSAIPYLMDQRGNAFVFKDDCIQAAEYYCQECSEPTNEGVASCSWCQIDDDARDRAAMSNSFRVLHHHGLLEDYLKNRP